MDYLDFKKFLEACGLRDYAVIEMYIKKGILKNGGVYDGDCAYLIFPALFDNEDYEMCDFVLKNGLNIKDYSYLLPNYIISVDDIYRHWISEGVIVDEEKYGELFSGEFYLIERGVELNTVIKFDNKLVTPLDLSEILEHPLISKDLREHGGKNYLDLTDEEIQKGKEILGVAFRKVGFLEE